MSNDPAVLKIVIAALSAVYALLVVLILAIGKRIFDTLDRHESQQQKNTTSIAVVRAKLGMKEEE